jgi:hypothetical protein
MEVCIVDGCDREAVLRAMQMCRKHYMRQVRKGSTSDQRKNARKECSESGCGNLSVAHALCDKHYRRSRHQPTRHEGRVCERCHGEIPPERNARAKFCSRDCKLRSSQPARSRRYQLKTKYGITEAEFDALLAEQGGGCAICGTTTPRGRGQRFHVDHCHETGKVRGILCSECNTGLGKFRDDPDLLRRALAYLSS